MAIKTRNWLILILTAIICLGFWHKLEYPRFSFPHLSIDKQKALTVARDYLKAKGIDTKGYSTAIIFDVDDWFNRYLQMTLGVKGEEGFIKQYNYDLFFWQIRFFKELKKEEYFVLVSAHTAEVLNYKHFIDDIASRPDPGKEIAKERAKEFLKNNYNLDLTAYDFHEEKIKRYENRIDYVFSWERKGVYIPWRANLGTAKLLSGAIVSGNEIREYYKNKLEVPESFQRYVENQFILGKYLHSFYFMLLVVLIIISVNIVIRRRYDIVSRPIKIWFSYLAAFIAIINFVDIFNDLQDVIALYPTSSHLSSFIGLSLMRSILNIILLFIAFVMPAIAGEHLCSEVFIKNKRNFFLHYLRSSFFTKAIAKAIGLGYVIAVIMLGLQAVIFYFGQKYLGVWREWFNLTQFSSTYVPLFSAFCVSITASLNEEITFRLFGISLSKKFLKNTALCVILTSFLWGLGHTGYAIFPVWFRVIEVTLLGLFLGCLFLKYGIIPLIVAHYLFDVFWGSAAYALGKSSALLFCGAIFILSLPLIYAAVAYLLNRPDSERSLKTMLDKIQKYNLGILVAYISLEKSKGINADIIREELVLHNWDPVLVALAMEKAYNN